ncbi:porin family protein [Chishuiella sp.]|uniref:porin family protein n=1 Tax=Chishuiella sp. TaxID=1969467 RepID=UPI0028AA26A7|nr:porin family protein [Chishuiella sp.]
MKKIFFIAATVLGIANLSAQEETITVVEYGKPNPNSKTLAPQFGLKSAANMSSYNGKDISKTDYAVGFTAGVYANFPVTQSFSIQPEVNFARLVGKAEKDQYVYNLDGSTLSKNKNFTTLDYIQVPVMFKYYVAGSRFNIEAGPQVGFLVYGSNKNVQSTFANGTVTNNTERMNIKNRVENFDFGVNYGVGYNLTDHINLNARYYMGLTKTFKADEGEKQLNIKNNSFSFGVGYSF